MRLLFVLFGGLLLTIPGRAQERVRNVRLRVIDSMQLEIRYDLTEARPGDSAYVQLESRLRGELHLLPEFLRGDLGKRLTAGTDRRIVWDALANGYSLNEDVRATVLIKTSLASRADQARSSVPAGIATTPALPVVATDSLASSPERPVGSVPITPSGQQPETSAPAASADPTRIPVDTIRSRKTRYAGPAWALLSAVAPGVGNIFVQLPKPKLGLRPLITAGCYGLVLFGLAERQKALDEYAIYEQQKNRTAAEPYYQTANRHHQTYFLATRGAVVVAAVDVVLTFIKGLKNSQLPKEPRRGQAVTLRPGIQAGQPTVVVHYSF